RQLPYVESDSIYRDSDRPIGFYGVHNAMVRDIDADTLTGVLDHGRPATEVPFVLEVRHLGGALGRAPRVPNAVGHRDAQYLVRVMSPLPNGEPVAVAPCTTRRSRRSSPGRSGVSSVSRTVH